MHKPVARTIAAAALTAVAVSALSLSSADAEEVRGPGSPGTLSGNVVGDVGTMTATEATHLSLTGVTADQYADFSHESTLAWNPDPWTYRDETRRDPASQLKTYWAYFELPDDMTAHQLTATMTVDMGTTTTTETVDAEDLGPYVMMRWAGLPSSTPSSWDLGFTVTADEHTISDVLMLEQMDRAGDIYRVYSRDTQAS